MTANLSDFLKYVRPEVPGCPEPRLLDAVLRRCIEFCQRTELLSEIITINVVAPKVSYTITPTDATLYPARLRNLVDENSAPLGKIIATDLALDPARLDTGPPSKFYAPTRNTLILVPIPDAAYTLYADTVLRPKRSSTTVPDELLEEHVDTIAAGAKNLLMLMRRQPWTDDKMGVYYKGEWEDGVSTVAAQVAQGNVGADMHISPPPI